MKQGAHQRTPPETLHAWSVNMKLRTKRIASWAPRKTKHVFWSRTKGVTRPEAQQKRETGTRHTCLRTRTVPMHLKPVQDCTRPPYHFVSPRPARAGSLLFLFLRELLFLFRGEHYMPINSFAA